MCELHFLLSGVGCDNTSCRGVGGAGGWRGGCFCAVCRLGVSRPYTHLYSQNPRGAQWWVMRGNLPKAPFCTPGFMARSRLFPEMGLTQFFPAARSLCCGGLWEGLPPPGWLWFSSLGSVLRITLMASLLSLLPSGGLLFSTPLFPEILWVECLVQRRGSGQLCGRKGGREGAS